MLIFPQGVLFLSLCFAGKLSYFYHNLEKNVLLGSLPTSDEPVVKDQVSKLKYPPK